MKVKDSSARVWACVFMCVRVCVCVRVHACECEAQRGVDESLTSGFIRVRNELPSRIFLLTYLGERWMDGWIDGWMDGWMDRGMDGWRRKTEQREIGRASAEVLCRGSFFHRLSRQLVCLPRDNHLSRSSDATVTTWSTTSTQAMTREMMQCIWWIKRIHTMTAALGAIPAASRPKLMGWVGCIFESAIYAWKVVVKIGLYAPENCV